MKMNRVVSGGWISRVSDGFDHVLAKLGEIISIALLMMATGCCHRRMGRPRTIGGVTYRVCLDCGMQRLFDPQAWRMYGPFSYRLPEEPSVPTARVLPLKPAHSRTTAAPRVLERAA